MQNSFLEMLILFYKTAMFPEKSFVNSSCALLVHCLRWIQDHFWVEHNREVYKQLCLKAVFLL